VLWSPLIYCVQALKDYSPELANVIRNGLSFRCNASDLVPGDIVAVRSGDGVPADCRVVHLKTGTLKVDQSILTGNKLLLASFLSAIQIYHR
jgi:Ca2+ transporting ATPase